MALTQMTTSNRDLAEEASLWDQRCQEAGGRLVQTMKRYLGWISIQTRTQRLDNSEGGEEILRHPPRGEPGDAEGVGDVGGRKARQDAEETMEEEGGGTRGIRVPAETPIGSNREEES